MLRRYCVILADADAISRVPKAWVPEVYDGEQLWFKSDQVVDNYIKKLDSSWDPARTLRMSIMAGEGEDVVQMVIPPALLNSNGGGLGLDGFVQGQKRGYSRPACQVRGLAERQRRKSQFRLLAVTLLP